VFLWICAIFEQREMTVVAAAIICNWHWLPDLAGVGSFVVFGEKRRQRRHQK